MQNFGHWLDAHRGRSIEIAALFGVTKSAVSQWRRVGVPRRYIMGVHRLSGVSLDALLAPQKPKRAPRKKVSKKPRKKTTKR